MEAHPETQPDDPVIIKENPVEKAGNQPPSQSTDTTPQFGIGPFGGEPSKVTKDDKENDEENKDDGTKDDSKP